MHSEDYTKKLTQGIIDTRIIYAVIHSVSRSGMSRVMSFYVMIDNEPHRLNGLIITACSFKPCKRGAGDGITVNGCGMDMGYHVAYELAMRLGMHAPRVVYL